MSGRRGKQSKSATAPALDRRPPWAVVYAAGADGSSPAMTFLDACPGKVDAEFGAVLDAVAARDGYAAIERLREVNWIAAHIRARRYELELTQRQVAERAGTSHSFISKLESGTHIPTIPVLARIFAVLDERLLIGIERDTPHGEPEREIAAVPQLVTA